MTILAYMNNRVKRLTIIDIKLAQGAEMCLMLVIVKLFPQILYVNAAWFVILAALLGIKPMYAFFVKK
jgi:hypothetical protein